MATKSEPAGVPPQQQPMPSTHLEQQRNDLLGKLLYVVTAHQFLHILVWATNANLIFPFLSYLFPGSIDGGDVWFKEIYKYDYYPMILHNLPLLVLLFVHHSIFARKWLQERIIAVSSRAVERTIYVAASVVLTQYVMQTWKPMPHDLWSFKGPLAMGMHAICAFGFLWTALSCITVALNDLFGFREAFGGVPLRWIPRSRPFVYQYSRSPLWFGMILAMWAAVDMSVGRLIFATAWTFYSWIAGQMQERDLVKKYGKEYEDYQRQVAFIIPYLKF